MYTQIQSLLSFYRFIQATGKITQLSVAPLLAQAIYNIHNKKSISALFK
jgi:phosphoribosylpyrophosphate synthetase